MQPTKRSMGTIEDAGPLSGDASAAVKKKGSDCPLLTVDDEVLYFPFSFELTVEFKSKVDIKIDIKTNIKMTKEILKNLLTFTQRNSLY